MLVSVAPSWNIPEPLTYHFAGPETDIEPGQRVIIPLANQVTSAWVIDRHTDYQGKVKSIIGVVKNDFHPDPRYLAFARSLHETYFVSMGMILESHLSPKRKSLNNLYFPRPENSGKSERFSSLALSNLQQTSPGAPLEFFFKNDSSPVPGVPGEKPPIPGGPGHERRFLVDYRRLDHYREIIAQHLGKGESLLIIVPDHLTALYLKSQIAGLDIYDSGVSVKEREKLWQDYRLGKVGVVVGESMALFFPIPNLGAVICDRAGSTLFKQPAFSRIDPRLAAGLKAGAFSVPFIEGFSAMTVEAFHQQATIQVSDGRQSIPGLDVHILTAKDRGIPASLIELLKSYFVAQKKVALIVNRKQSTHFLLCSKCKKIQKCPVCFNMLKVDPDYHSSCGQCRFEQERFDRCPGCGQELSLVENASLESLKKSIQREVTEKGVLTLSAAEIDDIDVLLEEVAGALVVIATPVMITPFFKDIFDVVIYLRPESLFDLDEYQAAEMIFSQAAELRELLKTDGHIDIFSTFHFHYSLRLINEEKAFFERELKYRQWFSLPPYARVFHLEVKAKSPRDLGRSMRAIYGKYKTELGIKRLFLESRKKVKGRGSYRGTIEAHTQPEALRRSGLAHERDVTIHPVMIG